ncbi:MAG: hypothetical protein EHM45_19435 [Desulfobacteraceae bacterium]|nr:MAG: hypothetical protein EHM45_19435 [Desulfobacteraceae bacterium]
MKIGLAQMKVLPGQPEQNVNRMLEFINRAKEAQADLIVFPEMAVGGYLLGDKWLEDAFCRDLMAYNDPIREASGSIAVAYGNVFMEQDIGQRIPGRRFTPTKMVATVNTMPPMFFKTANRPNG